eukprot:3065699-Rhodomonas_salina.1
MHTPRERPVSVVHHSIASTRVRVAFGHRFSWSIPDMEKKGAAELLCAQNPQHTPDSHTHWVEQQVRSDARSAVRTDRSGEGAGEGGSSRRQRL